MVVNSKTNQTIDIVLHTLKNGTPGITTSFGASLAEAASVCLDEQGHTCPTKMKICGEVNLDATINWENPSGQTCRCWGDPEVATEHGAYGIASLLVSEVTDLQVVERSRKGTGFDYWLGEKTDIGPLFQGKARLEVSGIRNGKTSVVEGRVRQKLKQTERSEGAIPAVVVVVEFSQPQTQIFIK